MENIVIAIVALLSAVLGGVINGLLAPYVASKVKTKEEKTTNRKELISKWRDMIFDFSHNYNDIWEQKFKNYRVTFEDIIKTYPDYLTLEAQMSDSALTRIKEEKINSFAFSEANSWHRNTNDQFIKILKNEVKKLEKEWDLI